MMAEQRATDPQPAVRRPQLPHRWRRRLARLPIGLYRVGLGYLFGKRLPLLHHIGRASGLDQRVVLEVVSHDPEQSSWTIASGFGTGSAWYQNLRKTPKTMVQVGNRLHALTAHFLTEAEGGEAMARYAPLHSRAARRLCAFIGFDVDGSVESYRRAGHHIPFVCLDAASDRPLP
ncbi:nitroreductase family deazaflavin-dependent oxidoreductase [Streptomyces sp. NPDC050147]|uniref:nitroreductase family deazaflavin-dependent oxidoreductase n=1 Tax=Streptomyces sp. NPDC050147 TaxID=3155513 RepID=UPI003419A013